LWLHSLKVAQLLRSAACLHTNQSRSYLNHLVDRLGMWTGVSLIWSALVRGTLSEPVDYSASESTVSHSVSRSVNRRVCLYVSHRQSVGKSFGQFRGQPLN